MSRALRYLYINISASIFGQNTPSGTPGVFTPAIHRMIGTFVSTSPRTPQPPQNPLLSSNDFEYTTSMSYRSHPPQQFEYEKLIYLYKVYMATIVFSSRKLLRILSSPLIPLSSHDLKKQRDYPLRPARARGRKHYLCIGVTITFNMLMCNPVSSCYPTPSCHHTITTAYTTQIPTDRHTTTCGL